MRIKRLEASGFKSFADPVVIDFDAPIIGIVGPNGCGKSNVVDSIRWVMGETSAKSLRGHSMEDVIFNGSDKRAPLGLAEVSLTFSTEDGIAPADYAGFTEITVTRRLYRSGESEYLINKVPSRLRDIVDLFLGTGVGHRAYSVIEQGKIDFVINSKPEDRRLLIEEAAGVSKFKSRKESALRKIESTELNLARLHDIHKEVTRQIHSLERQVKKAEKYKIVKNELREMDLRLASYNRAEMSREIGDLRALNDDWTQKETNAMAELASQEAGLEKLRLDQVEKDREYNALQERYFEVSGRLQLLETREGYQKKEQVALEESRELALRKIDEMKGRLETLLVEKVELEKQKIDVEAASLEALHSVEETERFWKDLETRREALQAHLEQLREERHFVNGELGRLESERRLHDERQTALKAETAKITVEMDEAVRKRDRAQALLREKSTLCQMTADRARAFRVKLEELKQESTILQERQEVLNQELQVRREEVALKRSRLKSLLDLEKNFEGYEEGVRSVLKSKKERGLDQSIHGVVADFIETAPEYELAVSAALGQKLQYVVVKSQEEGVDSINYLKAQAAGRSSFIPLEIRDGTPDTFAYEQPGVIGPLLNLVKLKDGYQRLSQALMGDVVLVSSLEDALSLWKANGHQKTLVTLQGEVVDPTGVVSGGAVGEAGVPGKIILEKKREIKELKIITAELEEEISLKEDSLSQLEGTLSEITLFIDQTVQQTHDEEMKGIGLENEVKFSENESRRLDFELGELQKRHAALSDQQQKVESAVAQDDARKSELLDSLASKDAELEILQQELNQSQLQVRQAQEKLTGLRVQGAATMERKSIAERELFRLMNLETELRRQVDAEMKVISEAHQKMNLLSRSLEEGSTEAQTLRKIVAELAVSQEEARSHYESLSRSLSEIDTRVRQLRQEHELARRHTGDLRVTLSKAEGDLHYLEQQIFERYSVSLSETASLSAPALAEEGFDKTQTEQRVAELKEQIERMGDVNLGAIPEFEELRTRQDFLNTQIQDLENSIATLKKAIHRINQTTKKRFEETFALVNERFQTLFPRLFSGGRAELRLVHAEGESQDLLNAGIEILVQPPGKKLAHVGLMSGGEKAMSALAFVFSIFLVKPSPFCVLDEVDAPLDDLNCTRFHRLFSEMISRTQFILITHNRRTMERADLLYGVTMQEPGVSKVVSVRVNEGMKLAS